jgi:SAM-dependent methyltransferase
MVQVNSGLRSILSNSAIYNLLQQLVGADLLRREIVRTYLRPWPGARVLDLGCGTAAILDHMPDVRYVGLDLSENYISKARARYSNRATLHTCDAAELANRIDERFDLILACGLLHHLDDVAARTLFADARRLLAGNGRLLTVDGCWVGGQSTVAKLLLALDRGRNVRSPDSYAALARHSFDHVQIHVRHDVTWIPTTVCVMDCST